MLPGISTACFYPQNTEDALKALADHGVLATEIFINSTSELKKSYLSQLNGIAKSGGTRILSVHPFTSGLEPILFFSQYQRRFEDGRELYKRYYEAASILGAGIFVFHGNRKELTVQPGLFLERFGILMEDARREGILLCHENVCRNIGWSPEFFRQLSSSFPEAGFVFDVKQAVRSGQDVMGFAKAMGSRIAHVHISDHDDGHDCLPPGRGTFNIREFVNYMRNLHYQGGVLVELYRENYRDNVELFGGYQHLYDIISTQS